MQATGSNQETTRSSLLLITQFMNISLPGLDKREYLRLRDFLLKLARGYDERRGVARIYVTKREQHYLSTEPYRSRILRMWVPATSAPQGESDFTLAPDFVQHYEAHLASTTQQRHLQEMAQARREDRRVKRA
jgi:hypothetical protein